MKFWFKKKNQDSKDLWSLDWNLDTPPFKMTSLLFWNYVSLYMTLPSLEPSQHLPYQSFSVFFVWITSPLILLNSKEYKFKFSWYDNPLIPGISLAESFFGCLPMLLSQILGMEIKTVHSISGIFTNSLCNCHKSSIFLKSNPFAIKPSVTFAFLH